MKHVLRSAAGENKLRSITVAMSVHGLTANWLIHWTNTVMETLIRCGAGALARENPAIGSSRQPLKIPIENCII